MCELNLVEKFEFLVRGSRFDTISVQQGKNLLCSVLGMGR